MLEIYQEYKFKKGGSEFHIVEGEKLKVMTDEGVFEGTLISVGAFGEDFHLDIGDESVKIHCNRVIDIIPV